MIPSIVYRKSWRPITSTQLTISFIGLISIPIIYHFGKDYLRRDSKIPQSVLDLYPSLTQNEYDVTLEELYPEPEPEIIPDPEPYRGWDNVSEPARSVGTASMSDNGDLDPIEEPPQDVMNSVSNSKRTRRELLVLTLSQEAKNRFLLVERSQSNRMVVRRFIYDRMVNHGLRPAHIRASIDLAVEMAFTPDAYQIEAALFSITPSVMEARRQLTVPRRVYVSWYDWIFPRYVEPLGFRSG